MRSTKERAVLRVVTATGISSVATQLLIIREVLVQFQGIEFVISLILFNWLILGALGTMAAHYVAQHIIPPTANRLANFSLLLAAASPCQILIIRVLRDVVFIHGASVGFYPTLAFTALTIAPFCLLVGFVLPYSLFVLRKETPTYPGARIYMADNLGDVTGGALFSFVLVYLFTPLQAVSIASAFLVISAWLLYPRGERFHIFPVVFFFGAGIILAAGIFVESFSLAPAEGSLTYYRESRYGRIEIHQNREQYTLVSGGTPLFTNLNLSLAEETVHYPLSQIASPSSILVISAEGGMMKEIEKYNPVRVDYVELDPEITEVQFKFGMLEKIKGLNILHTDGRAYLASTDTIYDAIIVNLPEPETFQVNRFFTNRFFSLASKRLSADGVFCFSMSGFDNYLAEPARQKISSLFNTARKYFQNVTLVPGQNVFFLCRQQPVNLEIPALLAQKGIQTTYVQNYFHGNVTRERIEYINNLIDINTPENFDMKPMLMGIMFKQWFAKFDTTPYVFYALIGLFCLLYFLRISREEFVLFSTGFMTMGSEILVIFVFQIFLGYIYLKIGLIITVFLTGLLPGAWYGDRFRHQGRRLLSVTDFLLIVLLALVIPVLHYGGESIPVAVYLLFGFVVSCVCGFQFPVALYLRGDDNSSASGAFSADLVGAACGTLVTSIVLIPYVGIYGTVFGLMGLKCISMLVMTSNK